MLKLLLLKIIQYFSVIRTNFFRFEMTEIRENISFVLFLMEKLLKSIILCRDWMLPFHLLVWSRPRRKIVQTYIDYIFIYHCLYLIWSTSIGNKSKEIWKWQSSIRCIWILLIAMGFGIWFAASCPSSDCMVLGGMAIPLFFQVIFLSKMAKVKYVFFPPHKNVRFSEVSLQFHEQSYNLWTSP